MLLLLVYVDDILITGESIDDVQLVIKVLNQKFAHKDLGSVSYYLRFEVTRNSSQLHLCQSKYAADLLQRIITAHAKPSPTPMSLGNKLSLTDSSALDAPSLYRSTVGALQYLTYTWPDLSFAVNKLSQYLHAPTMAHWNACKRVLRYIKGTFSHGLTFKPAQIMTLEGYCDADWASNLDDRKSVSGICIFLGGNLITWSSRKQKVVARSSTEAEYRALASAATDLVWIQNLLSEIGISHQVQAPILWSDNIGPQALACNLVYHARTKHIEIDIHYVRNLVSENKLDVRYVPTEEQPADLLTKALPIEHFRTLCHKLTMGNPCSV